MYVLGPDIVNYRETELTGTLLQGMTSGQAEFPEKCFLLNFTKMNIEEEWDGTAA